MEEEVNKVLEQLNRKHANQSNLFELEKCFREIVTELHIKTNQVTQLKNELEETRGKNHELQKSLDFMNKTSNENEFNANLIMRKFKASEQLLQEKRNSLMKYELQEQMMKTEMEHLRDTLQKIGIEKADLSRKNEALEVKHRNNTAYCSDIQRKQIQLNALQSDIQQQILKLQPEQGKVAEVLEHLKQSTNLTKNNQLLVEEVQNLKMEKQHYENLYVKINAKCTKLEEMISTKPEINEPNLLMKIVFDQWTQQSTHFEKHITLRNETITTLNEALAKEKKLNVTLVLENENLRKKIKDQEAIIKSSEKKVLDLEQKYREPNGATVKASRQHNLNDVKDEPIEVIDD